MPRHSRDVSYSAVAGRRVGLGGPGSFHRWAAPVGIVGVSLLILAVAFTSWMRPTLNWDMLPYVDLVYEWRGAPPDQAHERTYMDAVAFAAGRGLSARADELSAGTYRAAVAADTATFQEQLPFYRIRPLYVLIVGAVAAIMPTVSAATLLVSGLSYAAVCFLLLGVGVRMAGPVVGAILAALIAVAPCMTDIAALSTPDALTTLIAAAAALLWLGGRRLACAFLLLISVCVRTDMQLLVVCLAAAWLALSPERWPRRVLPAVVLLGAVPLVVGIDAWAGNYGYVVLYRFTFITSFIPHPRALIGLPLPVRAMPGESLLGLRYSLGDGGLWPVLALLGLCAGLIPLIGQSRRDGASRAACVSLVIAVGLQTCTRFVLFPEHDLRLNAPPLVVLAAVLLAVFDRRSPVGPAHPATAGATPGSSVEIS